MYYKLGVTLPKVKNCTIGDVIPIINYPFEVKRANLRKGISAQHLRNTYILLLIKNEVLEEQIIK